MTDKINFRQELISARKEYAEKEILSPDITKEFLSFFDSFQTTCKRKPICVFCYVGSGWEVPTRDIITALFSKGVRLCVPKCSDKGVMDAVEIKSLDDLKKGKFGLLEPSDDAPVISPDDIDLCVVPATAFDRYGYRIGRGGGYYDRFLSALPETSVTAGLIYEKFLVSLVPTDEYDRRVEYIITERGIFSSEKKG